MTEILLQYGVTGVCLLACGGYILKKDAAHEAERQRMQEEYDKSIKEVTDRMATSLDNNTAMVNKFMEVLIGNETSFKRRSYDSVI